MVWIFCTYKLKIVKPAILIDKYLTLNLYAVKEHQMNFNIGLQLNADIYVSRKFPEHIIAFIQHTQPTLDG